MRSTIMLHSPRIARAASSLGWRGTCFVACIPSLGALLAKVYGLASMQAIELVVALPFLLGLVGVWVWARRASRMQELANALAIGFWGGILGTIAYDVIRVPFALAGQRIFAPNSVFGVWIAEANSSSRFTEVIGWTYHYSNGIVLGLMYALFMRERHWSLAILWACLAETIAILCPFGRIFGLSGNPYAIGIAYLGHVAYGLPLGWLVYKWNETVGELSAAPVWLWRLFWILVCAAIVWPLLSPERVRRDRRSVRGEFRVEGYQLNPDWLRIERGQEIRVHNPGPNTVLVHVKQNNLTVPIPGGQLDAVRFKRQGIYQMYVKTDRRSRSSFIIVEPVEKLD